jgi:hypothetical protein
MEETSFRVHQKQKSMVRAIKSNEKTVLDNVLDPSIDGVNMDVRVNGQMRKTSD